MIKSQELILLARSEPFVGLWSQLFNSKEFSVLFDALRRASQVSELPQIPLGVHYDTMVAHHFYQLKGNNEILDFMEKLSKGIITNQNNEPLGDFEYLSDNPQ